MLGLAHCDFIKLMIQGYPSSAIAAESDVASFPDPALALVPLTGYFNLQVARVVISRR